MIAGSAHIQTAPHAVFRELGSEQGGVVLHLETTAYHRLNEIGTAVWQLIEPGIAFAALLEQLREMLDDVPRELEADVEAFLRDLRQRDLIEIDESPEFTGGA